MRARVVSEFDRREAETFLVAYHVYMATDAGLPEFARAKRTCEDAALSLACTAVRLILGEQGSAALDAAHVAMDRVDAEVIR